MKTTISLIIVTGLIIAAPCHAADWPQYLGPQRNGVYPDQVDIAESWPEEGPEILWTQPMGPGFGGAAIENGKVYVLDRKEEQADILRCFDLMSGEELWRDQQPSEGQLPNYDGARSTPTVDEKFIFAVGPFGVLYAFDKAGHSLAWRVDFMQDLGAEQPRWGFSQQPLLYKDWVISAPFSDTAEVAAFDKATGQVVWKTPGLPGGPANVSPRLVTLDGVEQLVITTGPLDRDYRERPEARGGTYGIDPETGKVLWEYRDWQCWRPIVQPTPLGDNRLFLTGGYEAGSAVIRVARGSDEFEVEEIYQTDECSAQIHPPLPHDGYLYINGNSNERRDGLMCMTPEGDVVWQTGVRPNFGRGGLILADGKILMMEGDRGDLYLIDPSPEGYRELDTAKLMSGRQIWGPLALSDGLLVVRDQSQIKCVKVK